MRLDNESRTFFIHARSAWNDKVLLLPYQECFCLGLPVARLATILPARHHLRSPVCTQVTSLRKAEVIIACVFNLWIRLGWTHASRCVHPSLIIWFTRTKRAYVSLLTRIYLLVVTSDCQGGITCTSWLRVTNQHYTQRLKETMENTRTWPVVNWRVHA